MSEIKGKILIVDDEPDILEILKEEFSFEGYDVDTACCGEEAVEKIQLTSYDAIISDYRMPRGNGLFILEKVNTMSDNERPSFFFITGQSDVSESEARKKGVQGFFRKPFDFMELLGEVQSQIQEK